jgi:hypothetical protein
MGVLVEAISVIIRVETLLDKYPGGWEAFEQIAPNKTFCADSEIIRVGFMTPQDVESFIKQLQGAGLEFLRSGAAIDLAVADQMRGLTTECDWLEFGHVPLGENGPRVAACRLVGSKIPEVVTPPNWKYEGSLSASFGFVPNEHTEKGLKYLRHENGFDVYLNPVTGKEVYVGRTGE